MVSQVRPRNDPAQYDDLVSQWWAPRGDFAMLAWIAKSRAALIPAAPRAGAKLLDVACGAGLLTTELSGSGYRHVGIDLSAPSLRLARERGIDVIRGDVNRLPFDDGSFEVVVAGEILEHVADHAHLISEVCRVLMPGGTLVLDTIADTAWARFSSITVAERLPAGPPQRLHDGDLFVDRLALVETAAAYGVALTLNGLRPAALDYVAWLFRLRRDVRMVKTRSTAGLFQAVGVKATKPNPVA